MRLFSCGGAGLGWLLDNAWEEDLELISKGTEDGLELLYPCFSEVVPLGCGGWAEQQINKIITSEAEKLVSSWGGLSKVYRVVGISVFSLANIYLYIK